MVGVAVTETVEESECVMDGSSDGETVADPVLVSGGVIVADLLKESSSLGLLLRENDGGGLCVADWDRVFGGEMVRDGVNETLKEPVWDTCSVSDKEKLSDPAVWEDVNVMGSERDRGERVSDALSSSEKEPDNVLDGVGQESLPDSVGAVALRVREKLLDPVGKLGVRLSDCSEVIDADLLRLSERESCSETLGVGIVFVPSVGDLVNDRSSDQDWVGRLTVSVKGRDWVWVKAGVRL